MSPFLVGKFLKNVCSGLLLAARARFLGGYPLYSLIKGSQQKTVSRRVPVLNICKAPRDSGNSVFQV